MSLPAPNRPASELLGVEPVPQLLARVRAELGAQFQPRRAIRLSRAPGRLDVMGGIADYTGSQVCELPLHCAAAVALQGRDDRLVQVVSFNLLDDNKPFTFGMALDALADASPEDLRREFASDPNRRWAGYLIGCLFMLQQAGFIDLRGSPMRGINLALLSTVPLGAGVSSSAAIEVATMINLLDHFGIPRADSAQPADTPLAPSQRSIDGLELASLCQRVENEIVGAPCGVMDQVTSCLGAVDQLLRLECQPHTLLPSLAVPRGMRFVGINSNVRHSVAGDQYRRTRCAAFMAHRMILEHMRTIGRSQNRELAGDPMNGYLANLDHDDYKRYFRPQLPDLIRGADFLARFGKTIDPVTHVEDAVDYPVQHAADHHVLEAQRVRRFASFIEQANAIVFDDGERGLILDKAGHLMYASHLSYTNDAMLGAPECDLLVQLVRERERAGLYGARITGGGQGGTVAVLCEDNSRASIALADLMARYREPTGLEPTALVGSSGGAWNLGTRLQS